MNNQEKITALFLDEASFSDVRLQFPLLPNGEYSDYELYTRFAGQQFIADSLTFVTEFLVFMVKNDQIVGTANYKHTESAEVLFDQINKSTRNEIIFDEKSVYNMDDWFLGINPILISTEVSRYHPPENYIVSHFVLKPQINVD